ncbi:MAG: sterol desaturase family protein [Myxococcales bacterium]|nr:sterol desaturase family protein [Myxococcales bacterium]
MFDTLVVWYTEPLFLAFPVCASAISLGSFLLWALPMTWIAWRDPPALRRYRIQPPGKTRKPVIAPALRAWAVNNLILVALTLAAWPLLRLTGVHAGPPPPWWVMALQILAFVYLDDFLYYWMHRAMHGGWLWKRIHTVHHRIARPWAITGHQMHWLEFVLTGTLMLVGPLVVGAHVVTIYLWIIVRQWEAAEGHCGYDFPVGLTHLLPGSDGALHHDLHHSKVKGNYAGFLAWTDRAFGTQVPGYAEAKANRRRP